LIVAIVIFAVGGGISAYEGLLHILSPKPIADPAWNYIVLGIAVVFEGYSFTVAFKAFQAERGKLSIWQSIDQSKDPRLTRCCSKTPPRWLDGGGIARRVFCAVF
jgi:divalent metal cation (Fe/Co/Zn/Cd) transporter